MTTDSAALPWRDATLEDAPVHLDADGAVCWAMGYNACREALLNNLGSPISRRCTAMLAVGDQCPGVAEPESSLCSWHGQRVSV